MSSRMRSVVARCVAIGLAVMLATPSLPRAQQPGGDGRPFKPAELEQIAAPIALYPDPLVAQIFMASTYPLEVIQAARFAKANPDLKDAALNEELKKQTWDDSVKALVRFPQVLEMMDSQVEWMQKLGDAVLAQQKETMEAIQRLRAKAQGTGHLTSTEQQTVIVEQAEPPQQQTVIKIEPTHADVIYVPTYNPTVVYGGWPYPAYPPYYYYPPYYPVGYAALWFGAGMLVVITGTSTILQTIVEDEKRGRVMSLYTMSFLGMIPMGSLAAGALADLIGATATLASAGACCAAAGVAYGLKLPLLRSHMRAHYVRLGIIRG